jgi:hypothetical protein
MRLLQLLLLVLAGLFLRRWYRSFTGRTRPDAKTPSAPPHPRQHDGIDGLTQQDISDADYEEIP